MFFGLSGLKQRGPDFSYPDQFISLLWGDRKAFAGQLRYLVPLACPGFPGGILNRCPCHLIWLMAVLHSAPPDEQASHSICEAEPDKVVSAVCIRDIALSVIKHCSLAVDKDRNVDCLVIQERCLSGQLLLYQKRLMQSSHHCWHCTDWLVDLPIHSSHT